MIEPRQLNSTGYWLATAFRSKPEAGSNGHGITAPVVDTMLEFLIRRSS